MIYLNVSYDQKEYAKSLGARWDPEKKLWYAPDDSYTELIDTFNSLIPKKKLKVTINKKNEYNPFLTVDLVPKHNNLNYHSLEEYLPKECYENLKTTIFHSINNKCQICKLQITKIFLCEKWCFCDTKKIQKLEYILGICEKCMITTRLKDKVIALEHLIITNNIDKNKAKQHLLDAYELWKKRNEIRWTLDLSLLDKYGILKKENVNKKIKINKINSECLID